MSLRFLLAPATRVVAIGPVALGGLALLLSPGCSEPAAEPAGVPAVEVLQASRGEFQQRLLLTGELKAVAAERIVVPRTPTWQLQLRWMESDGAQVVKDQKVLELDNSQFTGELEQKRLAESASLNELMNKRAQIAVDLADKEYGVEQARVHMEKATVSADVPAEFLSRREHQELQLALDRSVTGLDKAREDLAAAQESADAELEELRITLERAREEIHTAEAAIEALILRAPRDGILVVSQNPQEGRKFQVGDNAWVGLAVMTMPDLDRMKVEAWLSDVDDGEIELGMRARCVLDTYPDLEFEGTVEDLTPIAQAQQQDSLRRAFRATILLDATDPDRMRPGMSVKAEILAPPVQDVIIVPREALEVTAEAVRALLADGSDVEVRIGACDSQSCIVEDGLSEGTRLRSRG